MQADLKPLPIVEVIGVEKEIRSHTSIEKELVFLSERRNCWFPRSERSREKVLH